MYRLADVWTQQALESATLAIVPCRPGVLDLNAVQETIDYARQVRVPYAVVINGAPPLRAGRESDSVTLVREQLENLLVPVWGGQITQRIEYSLALAEGAGIHEFQPGDTAADEIARLWRAIEKSVKAIRAARHGQGTHSIAA